MVATFDFPKDLYALKRGYDALEARVKALEEKANSEVKSSGSDIYAVAARHDGIASPVDLENAVKAGIAKYIARDRFTTNI